METAVAQEKQVSKGNGKGAPVLMPDRFGEAEFKRHDFVVDAEIGTTVEQLMDPAFWSHVSQQMDPFDHIEVRSEDGAWIVYLVVLFAERNYARVAVDRIIRIEQNTEAPAASLKHRVEWKGPHYKFAVIRISDAQMLEKGFKTKFEAETWMRNHEKSQDK